MSGTILLVEGEEALSTPLRPALEAHGFGVETVREPRDCVERVRQVRPALVVLPVELPGGHNGYLLCGKLKKDEELGNIPILIIGNPDGFAAHRKLKARADEYLAHPAEAQRVIEVAERLTQGGPAVPPPPGLAQKGSSLPEPGGPGPSEPAPRPSGGSWPLWVALALAGAVAAGWFFLR
ncbi:MAG TPA: response regulator [Archangium sp.]|jgi:DNA-binding NtrC family response regulator